MSFLKFNPNNLQNLHFFIENINFPIAIASYDEQDEIQISYLYKNIACHTTTTLCRWCIAHNIAFQILYPMHKTQILKNPYKFLKFLKLKYFLRRYSSDFQKQNQVNW